MINQKRASWYGVSEGDGLPVEIVLSAHIASEPPGELLLSTEA